MSWQEITEEFWDKVDPGQPKYLQVQLMAEEIQRLRSRIGKVCLCPEPIVTDSTCCPECLGHRCVSLSELRSQLAQCKQLKEADNTELKRVTTQLAQSLAREARLRTALERYADPNKWEATTHDSTFDGCGCADFSMMKRVGDGPFQVGGRHAREALASSDGAELLLETIREVEKALHVYDREDKRRAFAGPAHGALNALRRIHWATAQESIASGEGMLAAVKDVGEKMNEAFKLSTLLGNNEKTT